MPSGQCIPKWTLRRRSSPLRFSGWISWLMRVSRSGWLRPTPIPASNFAAHFSAGLSHQCWKMHSSKQFFIQNRCWSHFSTSTYRRARFSFEKACPSLKLSGNQQVWADLWRGLRRQGVERPHEQYALSQNLRSGGVRVGIRLKLQWM